jgi:hypothetical protein
VDILPTLYLLPKEDKIMTQVTYTLAGEQQAEMTYGKIGGKLTANIVTTAVQDIAQHMMYVGAYLFDEMQLQTNNPKQVYVYLNGVHVGVVQLSTSGFNINLVLVPPTVNTLKVIDFSSVTWDV